MRRAHLLCGVLCALVLGAFAQTPDPILANAKREPKMLAFSRIIGGSGRDNVWSAATDKQGFIYISGTTDSEDFPITPGAPRAPLGCRINEFSGQKECKAATFVVKLSPDASEIIYSATIDASFSPLAPWAMAVAPDGSVYVTGQVYRPEGFPATPGAYRSTCTARNWCAFLVKVTPSGSALEFATFFAGSAGDLPFQVLVDSESRPWVIGRVQSTDYPVTPDALQPSPGFGDDDAFLSVFSADGKTLVYSTFFGGNGSDGAVGHLLSSSEILFAGGTTSSNFRVTADAFQNARTAVDPIDSNGFLAILNINSGLKYSTYLGGTNSDGLQKAVLSPAGDLFFVGGTTSRDFPSAPPDGRSSPTVAVVTGILNPAERQVHARTYPGYFNARILSTNGDSVFVEFKKGAQSTIVKISMSENKILSAYRLSESTSQENSQTLAPNGMLVAASTKYANLMLPNETTDIQIRGFRYVEREFTWEMPSSGERQLQRGQTLTIPVTLRDVGSGVPAAVKIRCEQVPDDLECSVTPVEVQLEDAATISVVVRRRGAAQAGLGLFAGLLFIGLLSGRRRQLLVVSVLGLSLVACGPVQETSRKQTIKVTAESESHYVSTTVQFTVE